MTDHSQSALDEVRQSLETARKRHERAEKELLKAREELKALAVSALQAGLRPMEASTLSGYTRAHLRQIARAAGIPPARRGGNGSTRRPGSGRLTKGAGGT